MPIFVVFFTYVTADGEIIQDVFGCYKNAVKAKFAKKQAEKTFKSALRVWIEAFQVH